MRDRGIWYSYSGQLLVDRHTICSPTTSSVRSPQLIQNVDAKIRCMCRVQVLNYLRTISRPNYDERVSE